ncbi:MAG: addiction module toxin RelE [Sulfurimonas sp. RIFCSPHIGHO2_12_FULL_36_9]|jgi:mRNA interferase RelE/StbE|uniref:type II toxin-antitoxin system RelE family toxin n=1 Tax=unclassified Sulfurimonas TaxID=2623549 RepID=UPI0008C27B20|nr:MULTISPECIES: type II toxin-antitoxin system RelE/ParE family toxin [unclassified Sulfurimonas]OHD96295.1 MAG: addiction module toxin RelE [Sulfurimonas sp. RIFCSPHIGHO2_12_FULL_36_9]OHD97249.1 MAG: addiction module toxin RelE [Sulfurimonas sp. RIFCSPLOWO2_02_FULL_36_28]OHE02621.1 MAG: addiction module toxin RelE [Sulfurimonas sp. RIFCSPLOWO2_12_36_12]OHE08111.1 MAG: addiction module toxin RelE [Sulfurimonas sp. RIFCSPLOWO2_12_FULL_36_74]
MYKVAFNKGAQKEFLVLEKNIQEQLAKKMVDLQNGIFTGDKALKGKHKGKFRKRAGDYRIVYLKENSILVITLVRIAHRREVY